VANMQEVSNGSSVFAHDRLRFARQGSIRGNSCGHDQHQHSSGWITRLRGRNPKPAYVLIGRQPGTLNRGLIAVVARGEPLVLSPFVLEDTFEGMRNNRRSLSAFGMTTVLERFEFFCTSWWRLEQTRRA
jgi:hypothetical protein